MTKAVQLMFCTSILVDFSKAFDKVPHKRLVKKVKGMGLEVIFGNGLRLG